MRKISRKCCTFGEKILSKFDIKLRNYTSVIITVENSTLLSDAIRTRVEKYFFKIIALKY